jgi:positive regulator of sigma E activity
VRSVRWALLSGILILLALVLILLAATVTSGAVDGLEIVVALILLVVSYLLQRDVRRQTMYEQPRDDEQPPSE